MKKIQIILTALLLITLVGCYQPPTIEELPTCTFDEVLIGTICVEQREEEPEEVFCADNEIVHNVCIDKTKPLITGIDDIEVGKYSEFDPLEGVVALDDVDGDITVNIIVESFVNTDQYGTYIVKYEVSDSAENTSNYVRYVTVVYLPLDSEEGIELVLNGNFEDDFVGWDVFNNSSGGNAVFSITPEDVCKINIITTPESYFWVPRISYSGMTIEQGKTYQVQFDIWADEPRLFHLQIGELLPSEPWFIDFRPGANDKIMYISDERETITLLFTMEVDTNLNGGIIFEFGHVGEENLNTIVYLDNISVKEVEE